MEDLGLADAMAAPAADGSVALPGPHGLLSKFKLRLPAAREVSTLPSWREQPLLTRCIARRLSASWPVLVDFKTP